MKDKADFSCSKAKIFIAGAKGMVGSAILRELQSRGYKNIITKDLSDLDLRNQSEVQNFFEETKPEPLPLNLATTASEQV